MPTVLRESGFSFKIYTADHKPMHVHARYQGSEVLINLGSATESVSVRENRGLNEVQIRRAMRIASENQRFFIARWREIYE